jgi:hypothetical protein
MASSAAVAASTPDPEKVQSSPRRESDSSTGDVDVPVLAGRERAAAPSTKAEKLSVMLTIIAAGAGLISDGCEWLVTSYSRFPLTEMSLQTKTVRANVHSYWVHLSSEYRPHDHDERRIQEALPTRLHFECLDPRFQLASCWSVTRSRFYFKYSNACAGAVLGQVFCGLICDRIGRKSALVTATMFIIIGATLG